MARNKAQDWPSQYLGFGLRLVPIQPRSKAPYKAETPDSLTGWHIQFMDSLEAWNTFIRTHRLCNTAILWPGVQIDCDSQAAMAWTSEHGLTRADRAWILKTSRGYRLFYKTVDMTLRPVIDNFHEKPDLLPPGRLAIVPDSIHPSGYVYSWLNGYSPLDIPLTEIQEVPAAILEYWQSQQQPARHSHVDRPSPGWLGLVFEAIVNHLESTGHRLRPLGNGGFQTTCPLHDDRAPSLSIHPERGYKCFAGCGEGRLTALAALLGVRV